MEKKPVAAGRAGGLSIFLPEEVNTDAHIIDVLIEERCPSFVEHWSWPVVKPLLYSVLGYQTARRWADAIRGTTGAESFDFLAEELEFRLAIKGLQHLPKTGRVVVVANHPTGLADGPAVWNAIRDIRRDVVLFANADAMRINPQWESAMIPVEWVLDKRSPGKTRETLRRAAEAFAEEKCIVIFPSGKLAKMIDDKLTEQDWFPTAFGLARKNKAPVIPLNIGARNSWVYYWFSRLNPELRDVTLFRELANKFRARFDMTFGAPIDAAAMTGDATEITERLRDYTAYELSPERPDTIFKG